MEIRLRFRTRGHDDCHAFLRDVRVARGTSKQVNINTKDSISAGGISGSILADCRKPFKQLDWKTNDNLC